LEARDDHDARSFAAIQADTTSLMVQDFLPFAASAEPATQLGRKMRDMLAGFDGNMKAAAPEPLIFATWYRELTRAIYADELGDVFSSAWWYRPTFTLNVMTGQTSAWCDDIRTDAAETCADLAGRAFDRAGQFLRARYGSDPAAWSWGEAHEATFGHRLFQYAPVVADLTEIALPVGGDGFTVNVGGYVYSDDDAVFTDVHGASMRAVFDLADLDQSRFVWAPGQSGHLFSPHYDDMTAHWRDNDMVTITARRDVIVPAHILVLAPEAAP
jgi:penicillin amidase